MGMLLNLRSLKLSHCNAIAVPVKFYVLLYLTHTSYNKKNPCKKQTEYSNDIKYELLMKKIEDIINENTILLKEEFKKENNEYIHNFL